MKDHIKNLKFLCIPKRSTLRLGVRTVMSGLFCFSVMASSVLPAAAQTPDMDTAFLPIMSNGSNLNATQAAKTQKIPGSIQTVPDYTYRATGVDVTMEQVAKGLAAMVEDVNVRKMIQAEADLQFDGDTNFLYSTVANRSIAGKRQSFANRVAAASFSSNSAAKRSFAQSTDSIKNLQIYVHALDEWDVANHVPLVAVRSENDPRDGTGNFAVRAFDANGKSYWLDSAVAPTQPVIVVGISERVGDDGVLYRNKPNSVSSEKASVSPFKNNSGSAVDTSTVAVAPPNDERRVCVRPTGSIDTIETIQLKSKVWKEWLDGKPEVGLVVISEHGVEISKEIWEYEASGWDKVKSVFHDLPSWRPDQHGGYMTYFWYESDTRNRDITWELGATVGVENSVKATIKVPVGSIEAGTGIKVGLSAKVTIHNKDDELGQTIVNCRDTAPPVTLSTADIEWTISNSGGDMPAVRATLPSSEACSESIMLDGSASKGENRYFVEIYPTTGIGGTSVEGNYYGEWTLDDRPVPTDLASLYPFKVLSGESTVYRVKLAVTNFPVSESWREKVQYVTVNATASASFDLPSSVAQGQPVIMDASASTGETRYLLEVFRTSGYGKEDVTGPYKSQWFNAQTGSDIPLHSFYEHFTPGWYKVKLAVQNGCTNWVPTEDWIQIVP